MKKITTDTLVKPDMQAVLSRTHIGKNLHGFLLPVLEAVSNGMHGIEARFAEKPEKNGHIHISVQNFNEPSKLKITIQDNGAGLDDANYLSFKTPFSGYKLKQNGRGFGRFIAFKVFSNIIYASKYFFFERWSRKFGPVVKMNRPMKRTIRNDEENPIFGGIQGACGA